MVGGSPDRRRSTSRKADEIVRFAETHGMKVRGHCLVWDHYESRSGLPTAHFTPTQLSSASARTYHQQSMKHYSGQVFAWDVVNEALDESGLLRISIGSTSPASASRTRHSLYRAGFSLGA